MERLHSDGAQNVHGEVIHALCELIGTAKSKSSRLHPQGDGMAESTVKLMKSCVRKQVDRYGQNWDLYLHSTAFAIRSNINGSTKFTPAELILGENLRRPIDVLNNSNYNGTNKRQAKEFASSLVDTIEKSNDIVNENIAISREKMKMKYDKKNSSHKISVGDKVMLWWPYSVKGIPRSFQPKWKGPWSITKLIDDTNCVVQNEYGETKNVHLNQLKLIAPRHLPSELSPSNNLYEEKLYIDFEELIADADDNVENVLDAGPNEMINAAWCDINENNILPNRTRNSR